MAASAHLHLAPHSSPALGAGSAIREDACCLVPRCALSASRSSSFFGRAVAICGAAGADPHKRAKIWRSFAIAAEKVVDPNGAVNTEASIPAEEKIVETVSATPATVSEAKSFLSDVSSLVKLVDSKDIVELELKHKDYEIVIKKAEALTPAAPPPSAVPPYPAFPPAFPGFAPLAAAPSPAPPPVTPSAAPADAEAPPALPAAPQYPPMVSPMAGNFYRSPGPGQPPFVKVGDRVKKGQVLCIVEAMKMMNEIESDQDGTIVEIVAEDGKPVATDTPLFIIKP